MDIEKSYSHDADGQYAEEISWKKDGLVVDLLFWEYGEHAYWYYKEEFNRTLDNAEFDAVVRQMSLVMDIVMDIVMKRLVNKKSLYIYDLPFDEIVENLSAPCGFFEWVNAIERYPNCRKIMNKIKKCVESKEYQEKHEWDKGINIFDTNIARPIFILQVIEDVALDNSSSADVIRMVEASFAIDKRTRASRNGKLKHAKTKTRDIELVLNTYRGDEKYAKMSGSGAARIIYNKFKKDDSFSIKESTVCKHIRKFINEAKTSIS